MALRVWLPLNGNLNNQGLSNIIPSGTPTFLDSGKMGKCISIAQRVSFTKLPKLDKFTVLFWLKVDSCSVDWADSLSFTSKQTDGSSAAPFRFEATTSSRACSFHNNSPYAITQGSRILITNTQWGQWHHCGVSYDGANLYTYIDGILTYTDTGLGGYLIDYFHIGETNNIVGGMNDLRIYDECLSQKQIKEISKGLVAHYKLEGPGANPNLLLYADKYLKNSPRIKTGTGTDLYDTPGVYYNGLDTSKYYIYSMCCDGTLATAHGGTSTTDATKKYWTAWLYYQDTPYSDSSYSSYKTPVCYHANCSSDSNMYLGNIGNRYYWRVKPPYANCSVRVNAYSNGTDSVSVKFWDFKLEEGTKLTTWLPNQADALYNTFGYNNMWATDSSGYGYNGTAIYGTLNYNADSARYCGSVLFNGTDNCIQIPFNELCPENIFTMNIWFKKDELGSKGYETLVGGPAGFEMDTRSGSSSKLTLYMTSTRGGNMGDLTMGEWNMVTMVRDGVNESYYINGQLAKTIEAKSMPTGNYFIGAWRGPTEQNYYGLLSDFRIYATTLSANDILTMYKNSGIIDNKGNVYAYEFKEE